MRLIAIGLIILVSTLPTVSGQEARTRGGLASPVQIELSDGDIKIEYVEAAQGMALILHAAGVTVQAQRLYLGDGKVAAAYEAGPKEFLTPNGRINTAALNFKEGEAIKVTRENQEAWGARRGEVYLRVPQIKFEVVND